jgi:hypothetical protein
LPGSLTFSAYDADGNFEDSCTLKGATPSTGMWLMLDNPGPNDENYNGNSTYRSEIDWVKVTANASTVGHSDGDVIFLENFGSEPASPAADFNLGITPAAVSVSSGQTATYAVSVNPLNGYGETVTLTLSGAPAGVMANFNPVSLSGSGTASLTLDTGTAPADTYALGVHGRDGTREHAVGAELTITAPPPLASPPTALPTQLTVDFNNLTNTNRLFRGQYPSGLMIWETESPLSTNSTWWLASPWGGFTTPSVSFTSERTSSRFRFLVSAHLVSLEAYNGGTGPSDVTLSCSGQESRSVTVEPEVLTTIHTGWTTPCSPVTIHSTNGWDTNFDDLVVALP